MSEVTESESRSFPGRVNPWLTLAISVAAVFGILGTVGKFFQPIKELDLTVWIQQEIEFSLPKEASSLKKLALLYDGKPTEQASLLRVNISNTGNIPIQRVEEGTQKKWLLTLRSTNGVPIEPIGDVQATPSNVEVSSQAGSTPDVLQLAIGLLNPKDSIDIRLALVGPNGPARYPISAEARIPGLGEPVVTKSTVRERIETALVRPLAVVAVVFMIGVFGFMFWQDRKEGWKSFQSKGSAIGVIIVTPLAFIFASAFMAAAAAWGLSWIVFWGVKQ